MTKFELFLLDKGYNIIYKSNGEKATKHLISTMGDIYYVYFHADDKDKRKGICFGLNEKGNPPTLIWPRPQIRVLRMIDGRKVVYAEAEDDSMNIVLGNISPDEIFKAMYDNSICFKFDLTKGT